MGAAYTAAAAYTRGAELGVQGGQGHQRVLGTLEADVATVCVGRGRGAGWWYVLCVGGTYRGWG